MEAGAADISKVGVAILGMGRSGTSSVTRMFASTGFFVGKEEELMPANEANPTGHWERLSVWRANERVLEEFGGSWFDPPSTAAQLSVQEWALPMLRAEVGRLVEEAAGSPVALKDPRIGVMMPLWGQIVRASLHPVIVVRDPFEIALSLERRDGTPTAFGLAAWELHMTALLNELDGRSVTVAPYAQLIEQAGLASLTVEEATIYVESSRAERVHPERASHAFQARLHRNRASAAHHHENLTGRQQELWHFLSSLAPGNQSLNVPEGLSETSDAAQAAVRSETRRVVDGTERAALARELDAERDQTTSVARSLAAEQERCALLSTDLQVARDELRAQHHRAQRATEEHAKAEQWLASIQRSFSWRITEPLRACKRHVLRRS